MTKIELEIFDDLIVTLNKIRAVNDSGIELHIPEGSPILDNIVSLKLLKKETENMQKILHFVTKDTAGLELLSQLQEEQTDTLVEQEVDKIHESSAIEPNSKKTVFKFPTIKFPKLSVRFPVIALVLLVSGAALFAGGWYLYNLPKAEVTIVVSSESLSKGLPVKVKDGVSTSAEQKTLRGYIFKSTLTETKEMETTGEKTVGKSAKGKIKIFNKTTEEKTFKKGQTVTYEDDDENDFTFTTDEEVTVSARVDNIDGTITSGEKEISVTASNIGENYNIKSGETLSIKDQKSADFSAVSVENFTGGKSEKVKVVAQADLTKLSSDVTAVLKQKALEDLKFKLGLTQKIIEGTIQTKVVEETFNHKVNDETEKVILTQNVEASALVYSSVDMDELLDSLLESFVPSGYVLSSKDKVVNIEVLGNSATTVLKENEADVQLTIKTYIVADITESGIKDSIKGKGLEEAKKVLDEVRNVNSYALNLNPSIPLLSFIPKDTNRITVDIKRE